MSPTISTPRARAEAIDLSGHLRRETMHATKDGLFFAATRRELSTRKGHRASSRGCNALRTVCKASLCFWAKQGRYSRQMARACTGISMSFSGHTCGVNGDGSRALCLCCAFPNPGGSLKSNPLDDSDGYLWPVMLVKALALGRLSTTAGPSSYQSSPLPRANMVCNCKSRRSQKDKRRVVSCHTCDLSEMHCAAPACPLHLRDLERLPVGKGPKVCQGCEHADLYPAVRSKPAVWIHTAGITWLK